MKFTFTKFIVLLIGMPCILNSCVKYDVLDNYDEDSWEQSSFIPRYKLSKDGMNFMNTLGPNFPVHILSYYNPKECLSRALNDKIGSNWVSYAASAITQSYNYLINIGLTDTAEIKYGKYFTTNNTIDECKVRNEYDDLFSFVEHTSVFGLAKRSGIIPSVGDLVLTKMFSEWGGSPNQFHCSHVTSVQEDMYTDSDGNQFSFEFVGIIYY